jgi:hypothetical protein
MKVPVSTIEYCIQQVSAIYHGYFTFSTFENTRTDTRGFPNHLEGSRLE